MSRKRGSGGLGGMLLLLIIFLIKFLWTVAQVLWGVTTALLGFGLIFYWLYLELRLSSVAMNPLREAFTVTSEEAKEADRLIRLLPELKSRVDILQQKAAELLIAGNGLARRQDGQFDERSHQGRELNLMKADLAEQLCDAKRQNQSVSENLQEIALQPERRYLSQLDFWHRKMAARWGVATFAIGAIILSVWRPGLVTALGNSVEWVFEFYSATSGWPASSWGIFGLASWIAAFAWLVLRVFGPYRRP